MRISKKLLLEEIPMSSRFYYVLYKLKSLVHRLALKESYMISNNLVNVYPFQINSDTQLPLKSKQD